MASDQNKPNGQFVVTPEMGPAFVESLPVGKFHGIGPATARKMNELGIYTGLDLKAQSLDFLQERFGKAGLTTTGLHEPSAVAWSSQTASASPSVPKTPSRRIWRVSTK
jgi:nucleotidyltransferase/DNA polymerase involved in DNA repair